MTAPATEAQPGTERTPIAHFDETGTIRIGRDPDNDIVINDLWVSAHHAELRRSGTEHVVVDLGSANGIYVNGRRVNRAGLNAGDRFTIGRHDFIFDGTNFFDYDDQGPTSLVADDITVQVKNAVLLDDVSFALQQGNLLGIIGPSGCGKSTLLKAMTGIRPASMGKLLYDDKNLYRHYSELRHRIGMVPQDDVLHQQLTVRRALRFGASLRFAGDVTRSERRKRVDEVIELLGLTSRARQRITSLSGGQRKRTSVALELLTEPSLLALDEPTSGLDPALDKEIMVELKAIAARGRTVVVVTHSVLHLGLCDRVLVMCLGGRMGYFGPPDEVLDFFQAEDYADVFEKITNDAERWAQIYRNSDAYRKYVGQVALDLAMARDQRPTTPVATRTPRLIVDHANTAHPAPAAAPAATAPAAATPATPAPAPAVPAPAVPAPPAPAPAAPTAAPATAQTLVADQSAPANSALPEAVPADHVVAAMSRPAPEEHAPGGPHHPIFSDAVAARPRSAGMRGVQDKSLAQHARHPMGVIRQWFTLCLRMITVLFSDRGSTALLFGLPLALGALSYAVPGTAKGTTTVSLGLGPDTGFTVGGGSGLEGQRLLTVLIVGAAFMGVAIAIREIINEASIYKRERAIGLSPTAYLLSKVFVFILIDLLQAAIFVYVTLWKRPGPVEGLFLHDPKLELVLIVGMTAVTSTALALLASALVSTPEQTTPILVISVMFQLVLSGSLFQIPTGSALTYIAWIDPSRWGFAAGAATIDLNSHGFPFPDTLWAHTQDNWNKVMAVLVVQAIILLVGARLALLRYEPGKG